MATLTTEIAEWLRTSDGQPRRPGVSVSKHHHGGLGIIISYDDVSNVCVVLWAVEPERFIKIMTTPIQSTIRKFSPKWSIHVSEDIDAIKLQT